MTYPEGYEDEFDLIAQIDLASWVPGSEKLVDISIKSNLAPNVTRHIKLAADTKVAITPALKDLRKEAKETVPVWYTNPNLAEYAVKVGAPQKVVVTAKGTPEALAEWRAKIEAGDCVIHVKELTPAQAGDTLNSVGAADTEKYRLEGFPESPSLEVTSWNPSITYYVRKLPNE